MSRAGGLRDGAARMHGVLRAEVGNNHLGRWRNITSHPQQHRGQLVAAVLALHILGTVHSQHNMITGMAGTGGTLAQHCVTVTERVAARGLRRARCALNADALAAVCARSRARNS